MNEFELLRKMLAEMSAKISELHAEIIVLENQVENAKIEQQFLTLDEAAEMLHVGRTKMHELIKAGEFGWAVKKGRRWLFPANRMKRYVSNL